MALFLGERLCEKKIPLFFLLFFLCSFLTGCTAGGVDADEWIIDKFSSFSDIKDYCSSLDDIVTLYLSSGIDQNAYMSYLNQLDQKLTKLEDSIEKKEIKPGTFTENTMAAKEAYDDIWNSLRILMNTLKSDQTVIENKDALSYLYLAYQEQLQSDVSKYVIGYNEAAYGRKEQ